MSIVLENLTQVYMPGSIQEIKALKDISLTIQDGEYIGIIGHTGSGKSTLVQHLNALILPSSGKVTVNGIDTSDKKRRNELRRSIGMVFQYPEYQLFDETVALDIAFGPKNLGMQESEIDAAVRAAMQVVGLDYDTYAEKSPFELSGGEKRRAAIAGSIATNPKTLVLDEPMAGLDPRGRIEIIDLLKTYNKKRNTIVMISHNMDDIAEVCNRVIVMQNGKIIMFDTPEKVFENEKMLKKIGLDIPQTSSFSKLLANRGVDIGNIMKFQQLSDEIVRRWKGE